MDNTGDMTGQERAALALWLLMQGPMDLCSMARRLGVTEKGCRAMLTKIARVGPSYCADGGTWLVLHGQ